MLERGAPGVGRRCVSESRNLTMPQTEAQQLWNAGGTALQYNFLPSRRTCKHLFTDGVPGPDTETLPS